MQTYKTAREGTGLFMLIYLPERFSTLLCGTVGLSSVRLTGCPLIAAAAAEALADGMTESVRQREAC